MKTYINKENLKLLLQDLVSIPSPYFEEKEIMEYTLNYLTKNGLPVKLHKYHEHLVTNFKGVNVVGEMEGKSLGKHIYFNGHLDTVKLCNGWTKNPYSGKCEGDNLYGLGALDMKSGCAAMLIALTTFKKIVKTFKGKISYHLVSDEEGPFGLGTTFLVNDEMIGNPDIAIIPEPSAGFAGMAHPNLALGARGGYNYLIKIYGKSSHAAAPELGINALVDGAKIVRELEEIVMIEDKELGKGSNVVIRFEGGKDACSVPNYCEVEVFRHIVRGESMETIKSEIGNAIKKANIKGKAEYEFRSSPAEGFDGGFIPYIIKKDNEFVKSMENSIAKICKKAATHSYFRSIGDFNTVGGKVKIPTIIIGPEGANYHGADEYVSLNSTYEVAQILLDFLIKETEADILAEF